MAGYSGTPLAKKLGIRPGARMYIENAPENYLPLLEPLPQEVFVAERLTGMMDFIQLFTSEARQLARLGRYRHKIVEDGMIWVSWPKKAARIPTDVTENVIRAAALPLGLVDTKVCAVDGIWSGLKLVIRVENRRT